MPYREKKQNVPVWRISLLPVSSTLSQYLDIVKGYDSLVPRTSSTPVRSGNKSNRDCMIICVRSPIQFYVWLNQYRAHLCSRRALQQCGVRRERGGRDVYTYEENVCVWVADSTVSERKFRVPSTQFLVQSTKFTVPSSWYKVPSTEFLVQRDKFRVNSS